MHIIEFLKRNKICFLENVPLSKLAGITLQGNVPLVAYPENIEALAILYKEIIACGISYEVLGCVSNTYLCNGFIRDILIITTKVKDIQETEEAITVGCGYGLSLLAKKLTKGGYKQYLGLVGIPGTVGAAAINNSGAFGDSLSEIVENIQIIDTHGTRKILQNSDLCYSPRSSILKVKKFGVLLSVTLKKGQTEDPKHVLKQLEINQIIRKEQIDGKRKSLGSIIAGYSIQNLWNEHKYANIIKKIIYLPFKHSRYRKEIQCFSEFIALGNISLIKHCDNIGRFCWSRDTTENDFFDYLDFIKKKSNNKIILEIDIKR